MAEQRTGRNSRAPQNAAGTVGANRSPTAPVKDDHSPKPKRAKAASDGADAIRSYVTRAMGDLVPFVTRVAYKRRSPAGALLLAEWQQVVGPRLAEQATPARLSRGVLTILCAGPVAMELQHLSAALIERINVHAGERLVTQLRFMQASVTAGPAPLPVRRTTVRPEPIADLPAGELNDALARLAAAIRGAGEET